MCGFFLWLALLGRFRAFLCRSGWLFGLFRDLHEAELLLRVETIHQIGQRERLEFTGEKIANLEHGLFLA